MEIASAPVDTLQGIAAKLRAMQLDLHEGTGGDYRETVLATIMAALERMEVSAAPDPLVALEAERREKEAAFIEANKVYYDAEGELFKQPEEARSSAYKARVKTLQQASQEASKRADAVDESIAGTPAISPAGIAVKLRRAADWINSRSVLRLKTDLGADTPESTNATRSANLMAMSV